MDAVCGSPDLLRERRSGGSPLGFRLLRLASVDGQLGVRPAEPRGSKHTHSLTFWGLPLSVVSLVYGPQNLGVKAHSQPHFLGLASVGGQLGVRPAEPRGQTTLRASPSGTLPADLVTPLEGALFVNCSLLASELRHSY